MKLKVQARGRKAARESAVTLTLVVPAGSGHATLPLAASLLLSHSSGLPLRVRLTGTLLLKLSSHLLGPLAATESGRQYLVGWAVQGLLTDLQVDLHDTVWSLLQTPPHTSSLAPDPVAAPLLAYYSSACCLDHTPLPPSPAPHTMHPLLPLEVQAILRPLCPSSLSASPSPLPLTAKDIFFPRPPARPRRAAR